MANSTPCHTTISSFPEQTPRSTARRIHSAPCYRRFQSYIPVLASRVRRARATFYTTRSSPSLHARARRPTRTRRHRTCRTRRSRTAYRRRACVRASLRVARRFRKMMLMVMVSPRRALDSSMHVSISSRGASFAVCTSSSSTFERSTCRRRSGRRDGACGTARLEVRTATCERLV